MSSDSRSGILAGGNFIVDFVKTIRHWPEQDTLTSILGETISNGGGPYNVLRDVAQLAPRIDRSAWGMIGEDANGDWILADCARHGIDTTFLRRTGKVSTSYTDAMTVESDGRRTFFHQRGANAELAPEAEPFESSRARIFLLGYLMLLDKLDQVDTNGVAAAETVLRAARDAGMIVAVDCVSEPSPVFAQVVRSALQATDILFINEFEAGQALGQEVKPERSSMLAAAHGLVDQAAGPDTTVVVHAAEGAVAVDGHGAEALMASLALPDGFVKGATGAGDAFAAGYLVGVHEGADAGECLRNAVCSAAQSLTHSTPSEGMLSLDQCLALQAEFGHGAF